MCTFRVPKDSPPARRQQPSPAWVAGSVPAYDAQWHALCYVRLEPIPASSGLDADDATALSMISVRNTKRQSRCSYGNRDSAASGRSLFSEHSQ